MAWRDRLREAVRDSGLTQREVAQRCGLAPETVSRILTGANAHPTFATVIRLARAVRVQVSWLLDEPPPLGGIVLTKTERDAIIAASAILLDAFKREDRWHR